MTTKFSFKTFNTEHLGIIKKPFATIKVLCNSHAIKADFLIDSGADITIIPQQLGERGLGFFLEKGERIINLGGAGGGLIPVAMRNAEMEIGNECIKTRVGWALIDTVPLILGRLDIFARFHIEFREDETVIMFKNKDNI